MNYFCVSNSASNVTCVQFVFDSYGTLCVYRGGFDDTLKGTKHKLFVVKMTVAVVVSGEQREPHSSSSYFNDILL